MITYHVYFRTPTAARLAMVSLRPYFTCVGPKVVTPVQSRSVLLVVRAPSRGFADKAADARNLSRILQVVNRLDALIFDPADQEVSA